MMRADVTEHAEQAALIQTCDLAGYPYDLIYAVPNGGKRDIRVAMKLKAEGLRKGMLDLMLPVARRRPDGSLWCGLYIEMKVGYNKPSDEQLEWIEWLTYEGYRCEVCYGRDAAWSIVQEYVNLKPVFVKGKEYNYEPIR